MQKSVSFTTRVIKTFSAWTNIYLSLLISILALEQKNMYQAPPAYRSWPNASNRYDYDPFLNEMYWKSYYSNGNNQHSQLDKKLTLYIVAFIIAFSVILHAMQYK